MMNVKQLRSILIPAITTFCGVPIIEADQTGDKPTGPHATFKITSPYIKGVGHAEQVPVETDTIYQLKHVENHKVSLSFTAYDADVDASRELAQTIHHWFGFYGSDTLDANDIVVVEQTTVQNRDTFIVDGYERRNGFDVTLKITKEMTRDIDYIETVRGITD